MGYNLNELKIRLQIITQLVFEREIVIERNRYISHIAQAYTFDVVYYLRSNSVGELANNFYFKNNSVLSVVGRLANMTREATLATLANAIINNFLNFFKKDIDFFEFIIFRSNMLK